MGLETSGVWVVVDMMTCNIPKMKMIGLLLIVLVGCGGGETGAVGDVLIPGEDGATFDVVTPSDSAAGDLMSEDLGMEQDLEGLDNPGPGEDLTVEDLAVEDLAVEDGGHYVLYNPNDKTTTYLIDGDGETVHQWSNLTKGGYSVYLLDNGNLLRPAQVSGASLHGGASTGLIQEITPDGTVEWEFEYSGSTWLAHHDIEPMPNGNVLLIAWEVKSKTEAEAAGRDKADEMWVDHIVEVQPGANGGSIVWEWRAWDHLVQDEDPGADNYGVVADNPQLLDVNLGASQGGPPGGGDWLHINGVSYNPDRDEIVISSHFMDEIYVIDHSTTTAEAVGHTGGTRGKGGDLLYRWGSPSNYASGAAVFDVAHCSWWVPSGIPGAGNILVFNNGSHAHASSIVEITPPYDGDGDYVMAGAAFGPAAATWTYSNGGSFFSEHLGGVQRLPSGNTFIVESTSGYFFEVDPGGSVVWSHQTSANEVARALRYEGDHPGIKILLGN